MTELIAVTTKYFSVCMRAKNSLSCLTKVERHDFNISSCFAFYSVKLCESMIRKREVLFDLRLQSLQRLFFRACAKKN